MQPDIKHKVALFDEMRRRIAEANALAEDDEAVIDTADGETDLSEAIAAVIRESEVTTAVAEGLDRLIDRMEDRKNRLRDKAAKLRGVAKWACLESGLTKISAPDCSISVSIGKPALIVTGEPTLADAQLGIARSKTTVAWDKIELRRRLESGECFSFAYLGNAEPVLTVRSK